MASIIKLYADSGTWGYCRVRLSDGRIVLEHRFVMEQALGRPLDRGEIVHHKDGNKHNNDFRNLEIRTNSGHAQAHGESRRAETQSFTCPRCGAEFTRTLRYIRSKKKLGQKHFLCGRGCRMPRKGP